MYQNTISNFSVYHDAPESVFFVPGNGLWRVGCIDESVDESRDFRRKRP